MEHITGDMENMRAEDRRRDEFDMRVSRFERLIEERLEEMERIAGEIYAVAKDFDLEDVARELIEGRI